jgi:plasmid stability protein
MSAILIRNLDDRAHAALRALARQHGRSVEAEAREILTRGAKAGQRIDWDAIATVDSGQPGPVTRDIINAAYEDAT